VYAKPFSVDPQRTKGKMVHLLIHPHLRVGLGMIDQKNNELKGKNYS
jgi:hypothetical protein